MNRSQFEASLSQQEPPEQLSPALQALWHERRGNWERAHGIAQEIDSPDGAWVHAYLHRREGDRSNAGYWYARASRTPADGPLDAEWLDIVTTLLARGE